MGADRILMLKLLGDTSSMDKSLRKSEGRMKSFGRTVGRWGTAVLQDLAIEGVQLVGERIGKAFDTLKMKDSLLKQTEATIKSTGAAAGKTADQVVGMSNSLEALTGIDDTAIQGVENMLLTFTNIKGSVFDDATTAVLDMSTAMGTDMKSAAIQVGKALNDPVKGLTALTRVGVTFTEEQKQQIKTLAGTGNAIDDLKLAGISLTAKQKGLIQSFGDLADPMKAAKDLGIELTDSQRKMLQAMQDGTGKAEAQRIILAELAKEFGGSAAAAGESFDGKLRKINNSIDDFTESILSGAMPALDGFVTALSSGDVSELSQATGVDIGGLATALGGLQQRLQEVGTTVGTQVNDAFGNLVTLMQQLQGPVQDAIAAMQPLVDFMQTILTGAFGLVVETAGGAFSTISALLRGDWSAAWNEGVQTVLDLLGNLDKTLGAIPSTLMNLVAPVGEQATALGQAILNGVIDFVMLIPKWASGAIDRLVSIIRGGINTVIDLWNQLDFRIPAFTMDLPSFRFGEGTVFDTGPVGGGTFKVFDGTGDLIPDIPQLAKGGIVRDPTLALIGESGPEAVVPLGQGGGMGSTYNIHVSVAPGGDLVEAGRQMVRAIQQYERRSGRVWRAA